MEKTLKQYLEIPLLFVAALSSKIGSFFAPEHQAVIGQILTNLATLGAIIYTFFRVYDWVEKRFRDKRGKVNG